MYQRRMSRPSSQRQRPSINALPYSTSPPTPYLRFHCLAFWWLLSLQHLVVVAMTTTSSRVVSSLLSSSVIHHSSSGGLFRRPKIAVVGGGASGIFAAIAAAESYLAMKTPMRNEHHHCHDTNNDNDDSSSSTPHIQPPVVVTVFEASSKILAKVKISGGGRCNVMHDAQKPIDWILQNGYPRGSKELNGLLRKRFSPNDCRQWFESRGVVLKTESDGRMFPITDSSQTVIDALQSAAQRAGVEIRTRCKVESIDPVTTTVMATTSTTFATAAAAAGATTTTVTTTSPTPTATPQDDNDSAFMVRSRMKTTEEMATMTTVGDDASTTTTAVLVEPYDAIIIATGSIPIGYQLAHRLGHDVIPTVPSLFTLSTAQDVQQGGILYDLAGLSVPWARVSYRPEENNNNNNNGNHEKNTKQQPTTDIVLPESSSTSKKRPKKQSTLLQQEGPLLITHQGLSGPAALRLSAFGAREMAEHKYRGELIVNWAPEYTSEQDLEADLWQCTKSQKKIATSCPVLTQQQQLHIPKRLWNALVTSAGISPDMVWSEASKKGVRLLAHRIMACPLRMTGKGTFKEEFVTAGGIPLKEIDMSTMQSKKLPGLFFCGEVINVDGVTGGFNFMNAWGTGFVAGRSAAEYVVTTSSCNSTITEKARD